MGKERRYCHLANSQNKNVDLRRYKEIITDTINDTVPGKHPRVSRSWFSTDVLTHSEAVKLGRALSRVEELKPFGMEVTQYRLFEGEVRDAPPADRQADSKLIANGR